jgi:hypothetical protein
VCITAQPLSSEAQESTAAPLSLLDVPYISQSELLCGGAAAAMVLRYWGERGVAAESFEHLVDRSAAGIRTDALVADLSQRGWRTRGLEGTAEIVQRELAAGRPALALIEDRPATYHYVVVLAWHERGVVFHDPARVPFMVMSITEFDRRWRAADRWLGIVLPLEHAAAPPLPARADPVGDRSDGSPCERAVADGVARAQAGDLQGAERVLASAMSCPDALRELAGVRVLQKRWGEAADLAQASLGATPGDIYAWKVLATSRFVQNDRSGALAAWNRAGEPRLDLVQIDGLTRTRHRVVEDALGVAAGELLTGGRFARAARRLGDLPAARSARLDYVPVASGLAELRGVVDERTILPTGRAALVILGVTAAATREVTVRTGSIAGGGEQWFGSWRFWPRRPQVAAGVSAPAPWGGVWGVTAHTGRQPFTSLGVPDAERAGVGVLVSDWLSGSLSWTVRGGADRWRGRGSYAVTGGAVRLLMAGDRVEARARADVWVGRDGFGVGDAVLAARSSTGRQGFATVASVRVQRASEATPLDLWWGGDTGSVRSALLRAHPILNDGRLRTDRLGRTVLQSTVEAQRWWRVGGPIRAAGAVFLDVARTARRLDGSARADADVGLGARVGVGTMPGLLRFDLGRGLRDGRTSLSVVYATEP